MQARTHSIRNIAGEMLLHVPLSVWRIFAPKDAIGVCYHVVSDTALPHVKHYRPLTRAEFIEDLAYLRANFTFTTYEELARRRASAHSVRDNSVVLTFDDGFSQCADVIAPILSKYQICGIFFVITDLIDNATTFRESIASLCIHKIVRSRHEEIDPIVRELNLSSRYHSLTQDFHGATRPPLEMADLAPGTDISLRPLIQWLLGAKEADKEVLIELGERLGLNVQNYLRQVQPYLTSEQIRRLRSSGFTIGAHSRSHQLLQQLHQDDAEQEIVESCRIIRDLTGQQTVPFAFPFFGSGIDRKWLAGIRRRYEFIGLFFDTDGVSEDERFVVQRVFGERLGRERSLDGILRRAWSRPRAWRRGL